MSKKEESLKDVFGMIQEALKDDAQMIQKRESRVREFETDSSLLKFPKEISCVAAMDELMLCYGLGGQVRHYYRYGEVTLCQRQQEKFNFCLKTKLYSDEERELEVRKFFKKRFLEDSKKGSSEDIWEAK